MTLAFNPLVIDHVTNYGLTNYEFYNINREYIENTNREDTLNATYFSNLDYIVNVMHTISKDLNALKLKFPHVYSLGYISVNKKESIQKELEQLSKFEYKQYKNVRKHLKRLNGVTFNQKLIKMFFELYEEGKNSKDSFKEYICHLQTAVNIQNESSFKQGYLTCSDCSTKNWQNYYSKYKFSYFTRQFQCTMYSDLVSNALSSLLDTSNTYDYFLLTLAPRNACESFTGEDLASIQRINTNFFHDRQISKYIKGYFGVPEVKYHHKGSKNPKGRVRVTAEYNIHYHLVALCPKKCLSSKKKQTTIQTMFRKKYNYLCEKEGNPKFMNSHKGVDINFKKDGNSTNATKYMLTYLSKGFEVENDNALKCVHRAFKNKKLYLTGGLLRKCNLERYQINYKLFSSVKSREIHYHSLDSYTDFKNPLKDYFIRIHINPLCSIVNENKEVLTLSTPITENNFISFRKSNLDIIPKSRYNRLYRYYCKTIMLNVSHEIYKVKVKIRKHMRKKCKENLNKIYSKQLYLKTKLYYNLYNFYEYKIQCIECNSFNLESDSFDLYTKEEKETLFSEKEQEEQKSNIDLQSLDFDDFDFSQSIV